MRTTNSPTPKSAAKNQSMSRASSSKEPIIGIARTPNDLPSAAARLCAPSAGRLLFGQTTTFRHQPPDVVVRNRFTAVARRLEDTPEDWVMCQEKALAV